MRPETLKKLEALEDQSRVIIRAELVKEIKNIENILPTLYRLAETKDPIERQYREGAIHRIKDAKHILNSVTRMMFDIKQG